ncbi:cytochrome P450 [Solicola sp. PLA-1-18]|uniref:cytochrome P450 n=1 Tax=Solicola sp. PLA-1-18 TaxID=3380532 RepID=UPI003B7EEE4C
MALTTTAPIAAVRRAVTGLGSAASDRTRGAVAWGVGHGVPRLAVRSLAARGDLQGRLIMQGTDGGDVSALIEQARAQGPLVRTRLSYLTADHAVVKEVLSHADFRTGDPTQASGLLEGLSRWANRDALHPLRAPSMLVTEPPDHTRYRKLVTRVFTARAIEDLRERTQQIADGLLDAIDPSSPVDLVEAYCAALPVTVIAEILGVPADEHETVLRYGAMAAPSLDLGLDRATFRMVDRGLRDFDHWLERHFERLRRDPGDDLFSRLVAASDEDGVLDDRELKSTAGLVLAAGFETTVNLLGNGIALLSAHPEQRDALRADPSGWGNTVDEVLRIDPPVLLTGRMAARDTTLAGVDVAAGSQVVALLAGANRDPAVFADPLRFDVTRENARDHLAFSSGRHYCLGAALARMEGEVGLRSLFDRFPDLELLPGASRRPTRILRGWERLPARLS